jgi:aspartate/methionine/tyrosine aminotransferase
MASIHPKISMWEELLYYDFTYYKYHPWGLTTLKISDFHLNNIKKIANDASVSDFQYAPPRGQQQLILSISTNFSKLYFKNIIQDEILITAGAMKAIQTVIRYYIKSDTDEIIVFEPYYPGYFRENILNNNIKKFVTVPFIYDDVMKKFIIDYELFKNKINYNTKLLILINPHNPSTYVFTKYDYEQISLKNILI